MVYLIFKLAASAAIIVAVSELSKRSTLFGALLVSLPLVSLLAMTWLYIDTKDTARVAQLSENIFWLVLPSLALFIALPALIKKGVSYYPALAISIILMLLLYFAMIFILKRFSIQLS